MVPRPRYFISICAVLACLAAGAPTALAVTVQAVRAAHDGKGMLDEQSVLVHVGIKPGDEFNGSAVSRDVKALQETGRFSFVAAAVEKVGDEVIVIYRVHPRPTVRRLRVEGASYMSNRKIFGLIELEVGDAVDDAILAVKTRAVVDAYKKKYYPDTKVSWVIDEDEAAGTAEVTIKIEEGRRARVRRIHFDGVEHASKWKLRKVMAQKRVNFMSWLTGSGAYDAAALQADRLVLKKHFQDLGFLDAAIGVPEVKRKGDRDLHITIPVTEGPPYTVGTIELDGVALFDPGEVRAKSLRIQPGETAAQNLIDATAQSIRDYYGSRGYISTRAVSRLHADAAAGKVDIVYAVTEGTKAYIRNVHIRGNTRTKDKVIRRELTVAPRDVFNEVRVRQSERRLRNLGFFGYVSSTPSPTDKENEYDLTFEVEEQRSGQFVVGAGFSSVDDIIGFVELSQGNFDIGNWPHLTGGGQKFRIRLQLGTERRDWQVSFTEPWFLDRRLSLGFDLFQHERRFLSDDYDQLNTGGSVSLTKPLRGPFRVRLAYSLEEIEVKDVDDSASEEIKMEEGTRTKSASTLELIRDTRDRVFVPTRGGRAVAGITLAGGLLGGETDLYEMEARASHFWPIWFDHVFNVRGRVAVVEEYGDAERVPIFDRMFLGGARTLRGFDFRDVGPKDENGEPVGGNTLGFLIFEYTVPVVEKIRLAAFYDMGMVSVDSYSTDGDLNSDYGFGIRFDVPGFPLQLDYAWPLEADEFNDSGGRFNFFIGYQN